VRLFLDTSVLLSAAGSSVGAPRFLIETAGGRGWKLISSDYCFEEVQRNWKKLRQPPAVSARVWELLIAPKIELIPTRLVLARPLLFYKTKDRPVLVSALAAEHANQSFAMKARFSFYY